MQLTDFVTSDTHFGHANIIKYSNRPFKDVYEMDEELIRRWNAKVPPGAVVYHLGDFAFATAKRIKEIIRRLNGRIRMFPGNHDKTLLRDREIQSMFEWFRPFSWYEGNSEGRLIVMGHYAFDVWNKSHRGAWHLHGHSHGSLPPGNRVRMDVGVDCHPGYEPFSYEEVARVLRTRKDVPRDHHGARAH